MNASTGVWPAISRAMSSGTARQMGWTTIKNGELLALAAAEFEVFVTVDGISLSSRIWRPMPSL